MRASHQHWLFVLLALAIALGAVGCGDEESPIEPPDPPPPPSPTLPGTWVAFNALDEGVSEPDGGTWGAGGTVITILKDGTGNILDPEDVSAPEFFFTWSLEGETLTIAIDGGSTFALTTVLEDDILKITDDDDFQIIYQRYQGPSVLTGTWSIVSIVNEMSGGTQPVAPGDFLYSFDGSGGFHFSTDDGFGWDSTYATEIAVVTIREPPDPLIIGVYTVVGSSLYLFVDNGDVLEDEIYIMKFAKVSP